MIFDQHLPRLSPAEFEICPEGKEDTMKKGKNVRKPDYGCDSQCVSEYIECIEKEGGASICKTRKQNCLDECPL